MPTLNSLINRFATQHAAADPSASMVVFDTVPGTPCPRNSLDCVLLATDHDAYV